MTLVKYETRKEGDGMEAKRRVERRTWRQRTTCTGGDGLGREEGHAKGRVCMEREGTEHEGHRTRGTLRENSKCNTPDLLVPCSVVGINIDVSIEAGGTHATNEKNCGVQDASLDNLTYPWEKNCKRWPFSIAWTPIQRVPLRVTRH